LNGNFLTLNLNEVQALAQSVPWVRRAVVRRVFPNRLSVAIEEHEAFAWWQTTDGSSFVNTHGELFEAFSVGHEFDDIPELAGPEAQVQQIKQTYKLISPLFADVGLPIFRLELTTQGEWQVALRNGALVALGRGSASEIQMKVQRFVATLPKVVRQFGSELETADLRYPHAYAVRLKGVGTITNTAAAQQDKRKVIRTAPTSR
jgi:cell division protein FtsQ